MRVRIKTRGRWYDAEVIEDHGRTVRIAYEWFRSGIYANNWNVAHYQETTLPKDSFRLHWPAS